MKRLLILPVLLLCAFTPRHRILHIVNRAPHDFLVLMASTPPRQSFAFTFVPGHSSVDVDIDTFEYRTIGDYSRPCSPLIGQGAIWFITADSTNSAPVNWDNLTLKPRVSVSPSLDIKLKR